MREKTGAITIFILCLTFFMALRGDDFFKVHPDAGKSLSPDKIYPQGRRMLISGYSPKNEWLPELKKAGFSCAGPVYAGQEQFAEACRKAGMPRFHAVQADGITLKVLSESGELDWSKIEQDLRTQVRANAGDSSVAAWNLLPEELRYWRKNELEYLRRAYRIIKENDPAKRPVYLYLPGHRNRSDLVPYLPYVDYLGKGMYVNYAGYRDNRVWCRWSMEQQTGAIADAKSGAVPLALPEMFQEPPTELFAQIPAWARHDVYCSLVNGGRGVVIFSLWPRKNFDSWKQYYPAYNQIAGELKKLGEVFLFGTPCRDIKMKIVSGPETASCSIREGKENKEFSYPAVSFADLSHQGRRYLFAVNSSNDSVTAEFSGLPQETLVLKHALDGKRVMDISGGAFRMEFAGLEVKLLEISK